MCVPGLKVLRDFPDPNNSKTCSKPYRAYADLFS